MSRKGMWIKLRKPIKPYPETTQQTKVKIGGLLIRELCTGKKGSDFFECRSEVLACAFDDEKCGGKLLELKEKLLEQEI